MQQHRQPEKINEPGIQAAMTGKTITRCVYCGTEADMVCQACDDENEARNQAMREKEQAEEKRKRATWFSEKIPDEYRATDELLRPQWSRDLVKRWNAKGRHGVTLVGDSGSFKTRTACKLLEKAFLGGQIVEFHQAGDLRRKVNALSRDGKDAGLLDTLGKVPILVIDDIGNQAWTEPSEEFFLALLERRQGNQLKTIVTTQYPGAEFVAKFTNKRIATAIGRRIGSEYNWIVRTNVEPTRTLIEPPTSPKPPAQ